MSAARREGDRESSGWAIAEAAWLAQPAHSPPLPSCCVSLCPVVPSRPARYHRSYGLVTPPTNPAFSEYRLGDLATAPLFRRDHLGFRVEYPDAQFTWSDSANKLKKNQKQFGEQGLQRSESPALEQRRVQWRGGPAHSPSGHSDSLEEQQRQQAAYYQYQQRQFEEAYAQRQAAEAQQQQQQPPPPSQLQQNGRAILTSSLAPSRLSTASGLAPIWGPQAASHSSPLTQAERQVIADKTNPHRYPTPGFKSSPYNPQFDGPNQQQQR